MHSQVWGSHRAKFDDDDLRSFLGIDCEGTHRHTHTDSGSSTLNCFKARVWKQKETLFSVLIRLCAYRQLFVFAACGVCTTRSIPCHITYKVNVNQHLFTRAHKLREHCKVGVDLLPQLRQAILYCWILYAVLVARFILNSASADINGQG